MIRSFRHKGLRRLFEAGDQSGIDPRLAAKLRRQLLLLHTAAGPQGMNLPGYRLHQLSGDRRGQWSVWVSGNMRLVFSFAEGEATDVDLVDDH